LDQRLSEYRAKLEAAQQQVGHWASQINDLDPQPARALLAERSRHNQHVLEQIERTQDLMLHLTQEGEKKLQARLEAERNQQQAKSERDKAEQEQQRLKEEQGRLVQEVQVMAAKTLALLACYGIQTLPEDAEDVLALEEHLKQRQKQWLQHQHNQNTLRQELSVVEAQVQEIQANILRRAEDLHEKDERIQAQEEALAQLTQERWQVFAEQDPECVERTLLDNLQKAEAAFLSSQKKHADLVQERERIQASIQDKEAALRRRQGQMLEVEAAFLRRLQEKGFASEAVWLAAQLSEEERKALRRKAEALNTRRTRWDQQRQDRQERLLVEEGRCIKGADQESLNAEQEKLLERLRQIPERIGSLEQRLRDNQERRQQQQALLQALEAQNREYLRWKTLYDLIGSADGKKYRNFAQGLTFEHLLAHANQQLAHMSDRYRLLRDDAQPLEITVIDAWQAGEIRSTKNLSGGESFVVSLALALGLANMVGGTVRLDSLFLDEGFGVLDEEALETALDTLAGLHQEGKLIGVISHVAALKERISCRIEVIPQSGGRSSIQGPGVHYGRPAHEKLL
jgi:exonuclease SbcC